MSKFREEEVGAVLLNLFDSPTFPKGHLLNPAHPLCLLNALWTYPNFLSYSS